MKSSLYFAYGSNLNVSDFDAWCDRNGFRTKLIRPIGIGRLGDQKLSFSHYSNARRGGALNLETHLGGVVEGVVFKVEEREGWDALDRKEGVPNVYQSVELDVMLDDGTEAKTTTYIVGKPRFDFSEPTQDYVAIVAKGLDEFGLCSDALHAAAKHRAPPVFTDAIFVYGTLMRGEVRFGDLEAIGILYIASAETKGLLLDQGCGYPGMVNPSRIDQVPSSTGSVAGEFARISDLESGLCRLDAIGGFKGFGEIGSLFVRRLTRVFVGSNRVRWAWAYHMECDPTDLELITSGCWRIHCGRKTQFLEKLVDVHAPRPEHEKEFFDCLRQLHPWESQSNRFPTSTAELVDGLAIGSVCEFRLIQASGNDVAIWT